MAERELVLGIDRIAAGDIPCPNQARVAFLTNRAARDGSGAWAGDVVRARCRLEVFLVPEHGLGVEAGAGEPVPHAHLGDIPVLSLYGADRAPVEEAIDRVDVLLVDLPDVGARYYTYGWSLREALKLARRLDKPVWILDRPNPLGGVRVEGNLPDPGIDSPVCASRVTVRHGMTLGELAQWQARTLALDLDLMIVKAEGWTRRQARDHLQVPWTPPSPALPSPTAALVYCGTCLLEGTNVSEGRGTETPFLLAGAPFVEAAALARRLSASPALAGGIVEEVHFTPRSGKWAGAECHGVRLGVSEGDRFLPVRAGLALIAALSELPDFRFLPDHFDALAGTPTWRQALEAGVPAHEIMKRWEPDEANFRSARQAVLLYD